MEVGANQNLRHDRMSDCRSIGSNYYPSSQQSRKISIGVVVDSVTKKGSGRAKEDKVTVLGAEKMNPNVENSIEVRKKGQGVTTPVKGKPTDTLEQESSPWITTRSLYQQAPVPETVLHAQPATSGCQNKFNGQNNEMAARSVQSFLNKTSILQPGDGKQNTFDGFSYKRKEVKDGTTEMMEEFTFATAQEVDASNKMAIEDKAGKTGNKTETLRMKLWEILGNVSSPTNEYSNSQRHKVGADDIEPGQNFDQKVGTVVRSGHNSDTIETGSEASDHASTRPITPTLIRKGAPLKVQVKVTTCCPTPGYMQKYKQKNFSLDEGWSGRGHSAVNGGSSKLMRKNIEKKSIRVEPRKIIFPKKDMTDKIQETSYRNETTVPAEKTFSHGNKMEDIHDCISEDEREWLGPENNILEQNSHQSPLTDKAGQQEFKSPGNGDRQDIANPSLQDIANPSSQDIADLSLLNDVEPQDTFQSPRFKTPIASSTPTSTPNTDQLVDNSHSSSPKSDQLVNGVKNPAPSGRIITMGDIRSFSTLQTSNRQTDCYGSNRQTDFLGDAGELKNSPPLESVAAIEEKDTEDDLSESSAEERDRESLEEGSPIIEAYTGCGERDTLHAEPVDANQPKFMLHSTKRLRTCEGIRFDNISPTSSSPKGTGESNWIQEPLEESQEDEMLRAIKLFALELQKAQSKIKSETTKKSSRILMSISDGIYFQLQNLESHIQKDVGKITALSKSKRKQFEGKLEEKRKELKLIHENFKEDINRHLQDYRSALEGLETHHIELKGTMEKQKASHRKLLLQVEEALEAQLNDAQRRIAAIHELARGKTLQLKDVISLCLKDGILS
ncbi:hypothetical protein I3843_07G124700 [Carya illinoinensis]|nr:meiosis-specific protein ASY3-like [Carya illinoinensis]KAG7971233.1 hypothetical protein I3843_07G124700 [Carya illinoinensis]KAG7971234.1 hypothetical protein I3843_07G124700 [Carya illinoinensis]